MHSYHISIPLLCIKPEPVLYSKYQYWEIQTHCQDTIKYDIFLSWDILDGCIVSAVDTHSFRISRFTHSDSASALLYLTCYHTCSLLCEAGSTAPREVFDRDTMRSSWFDVAVMIFIDCRSTCNMQSLYTSLLAVLRAFMASVASQAEEAESSRTSYFTSGFNGLIEFDHGVVFAILTVP